MGTQWHGMGRDMMVFDVFRDSILRSDTVLSAHGVNLHDLIMTAEEAAFEDTVNSFICIAAIQVFHPLIFWRKERCFGCYRCFV